MPLIFFRSYGARTGRYSQPDPIGLQGGWNRFGYVDANPLGYVDPLGLDFMDRMADRAAGIPEGRAGNQYDLGTITINRRGVCTGNPDPMCSAGMRAAGLPGPYTDQTKTFSVSCLATMGIVVKGGGAVGGNAIVNQAPRAARYVGVGAKATTIVEQGVALFTSPYLTILSLVGGGVAVLEHCEVKRPPICRADER
ncbi:RHS repeat-associated core domain-containing protein [Variovorax sp. EL159]|uniref:RHS repeat-associated core domain-containing protein n=1 Tax=Variovorax sp. EL159 TaxID=1566270 RepID=UPI001C40996E